MRDTGSTVCRLVLAAIPLGAVGLVPVAAWGQQPFFMGLGHLPTATLRSIAYDVSGDGSTVVGFSQSTDDSGEAMIWTRASGLTGLGTIGTGSQAWAISKDGKTVVGATGENVRPNVGPQQAFRWRSGTGMVLLPKVDGGDTSNAIGISADGSVIIGIEDVYDPFHQQGVRWTEGQDAEALANIIGFDLFIVSAISSDGATIGGLHFSPDRQIETGFLWNESTGVQFLNDLPGGFSFRPKAFSDNGRIVAGYEEGKAVFRRTANGAYQQLPPLPDGSLPTRLGDMSADGSVIVGTASASSSPFQRPFIWDQAHGSRDLFEVLRVDFGFTNELAGWNSSLANANGISADGRTIVGGSTRVGLPNEAWIAYLGPASPTLTGDYDRNGAVDGGDFLTWQRTLGSMSGLAADGNGNGVVDHADLGAWKNQFGRTTSLSSPAPEPGTMALLACPLLVAIHRSRISCLCIAAATR